MIRYSVFQLTMTLQLIITAPGSLYCPMKSVMLYGNVIIFSVASSVTNFFLSLLNINWIIPKLKPNLLLQPVFYLSSQIKLNSMRNGSKYNSLCVLLFFFLLNKQLVRTVINQRRDNWLITNFVKGTEDVVINWKASWKNMWCYELLVPRKRWVMTY